MKFSSDLGQLARNYVTASVGLLAVLVSIAWWTGCNVSVFVDNEAHFYLHPWLLVTSIFPHINAIHLLFNLYWLWHFGSFIERRYGAMHTAGIYLLLAIGSSSAEYVFSSYGVGLSGVVYGLFGLLWAVRKYDPFLAQSLDKQTVRLFVVWFFLCIVMTYTKVMPIGNYAHGGGLIFGLLLGAAIIWHGRRKTIIVGAIAVLMLSLCVASYFTAERLNTLLTAEQLAYDGYTALVNNDNQKAVDLYNASVNINSHNAYSWYNLGVGYCRLSQTDEALNAFRIACSFSPPKKEHIQALDQLLRYQAAQYVKSGNEQEAAKLLSEADALMTSQSSIK